MISINGTQSQLFEIVPLKNGSNILRFDVDQNHLHAYLPVQSTIGLILPQSTSSPLKQSYVIGDIVCFHSKTNFDDTTLESNRWTADDGMRVDSTYGISQMIAEGERHLYVTIDGQTIISERFQVNIPNEINLARGMNDFLYDGQQGKTIIVNNVSIIECNIITFVVFRRFVFFLLLFSNIVNLSCHIRYERHQ
jgi:hypothetical protein